TLKVLTTFKPDVILVDVLTASDAYMSLLKNTGAFVFTLDRDGKAPSIEDIAIHPIRSDGAGPYRGYPYMVLPDLEEAKKAEPLAKDGRAAVFVSFGGYDAARLTEHFLDHVN